MLSTLAGVVQLPGAMCAMASIRAHLFAEELWLFPGCVVSARVSPVAVDQIVVCPLCPTSRSLIVLTRKDTHRRRDGDLRCGSMVDMILPVEPGHEPEPVSAFGSVEISHRVKSRS